MSDSWPDSGLRDSAAHPACVQLRVRAALNLPTEDYKFIYVRMKADHLKKTRWKTQTVPVSRVNGGALIDFWARVPADGLETKIMLEVI